MRIFCDLHHQDLYYSLQLLFEKRLGAEMYRPIGIEWWEQGFWNVYNHPATAQQYLGLNQVLNIPLEDDGITPRFKPEEMMNQNYRVENGIYYVMDPSKNKLQRAITLEKFREMKFDLLISSMPQHIQPFNRLIQLYQPQAKHIFQIGNAWGHQPGVSNILSSTAPFYVPSNINSVFYHQEFDLDTYKYTSPTQHTTINSYIHMMRELDLFQEYKKRMSDFRMTTYGAGMDDCLHGSQNHANAMINSGWTWHVKPEGDGYGHNLFNSYACGRPTIVKANYYQGKLASLLFEDKKTCIDISRRSIDENVDLIRYYSQPEEHNRMCENAYNRFKEVVDFDKEEKEIRAFLNRLV